MVDAFAGARLRTTSYALLLFFFFALPSVLLATPRSRIFQYPFFLLSALRLHFHFPFFEGKAGVLPPCAFVCSPPSPSPMAIDNYTQNRTPRDKTANVCGLHHWGRFRPNTCRSTHKIHLDGNSLQEIQGWGAGQGDMSISPWPKHTYLEKRAK